MIKSRLFAKGRKYLRSSALNSSRRFPDPPLLTTTPNTTRITAPRPCNFEVAISNAGPPNPTNLLMASQNNLLKNYQLEINRNETTISNLRRQISRLTESNANMMDVLRQKQNDRTPLHNENKKLKEQLQSVMSSWATAIGSIDTSVAIKCGLKLTDDQYEGLRRLISYKFNSETGRHEIKIEAQTDFRHPALKSLAKVRNWVDSQMDDLGLKDTASGSWLSVDRAIEELMGHVGVYESGGKLYVQVLADAVRVYRKTAFTTVGLRALQDRPDYNSMCTMTLLGIIEGSDDYANLKACMSDVAACMKKCAGGLWDKFEFVFLGGGDQMSIASILALAGKYASMGQNCNYCEIESVDLLKDVDCVQRTLARIYHQAHLFPPNSTNPFACPSCGKQFNDADDVLSDQAPGDRTKYTKAHAGVSWKVPPLLDIEPISFIVCCLHLLLSLTKLLFKTLILPMLINDGVAQCLNQMLRQIGICVPKQQKVDQNVNKNQSARIKFTGAECLKLLEYWDAIVAKLLVKGGNGLEMQEWAQKANSLSTKMLSFYNRLKTRALDVQEKNVKAREVAEAARGLRSELTAFRGNEFVNYYLHCAIAHLPEQIRMCPVDIFDASGCAIEHLHIDVKRNLLHRSSKKGARVNKRTGRVSRGRAGQGVALFHARMRVAHASKTIRNRLLKSASRRSKRLRDEGRVSKPVVKKEVERVQWCNVESVECDGEPCDVNATVATTAPQTIPPTTLGSTAVALVTAHVTECTQAARVTTHSEAVGTAMVLETAHPPATKQEVEPRRNRKRKESAVVSNKKAAIDATRAMKKSRGKK